MFKKYHLPHYKDDDLILPADGDFYKVYLFILGIILLFGILISFAVDATEDKITYFRNLAVIIISIVLIIVLLLKKSYVITTDSIYVKHGILKSKINIDRYINCYVDRYKFITFIDSDLKDYTIDLDDIKGEYCDQFLNLIRQHDINIFDINTKKHIQRNNSCQDIYKFSVHKQCRTFLILLNIVIILFIFSLTFAAGITTNLVNKFFISGLFSMVLIFFPELVFSNNLKINVDGPQITISDFPIKTKNINVSEITKAYKGPTTYYSKGRKYTVDEIHLQIGQKLLYTHAPIDQYFRNYDIFASYLRDNNICLKYNDFSTDDRKKLHFFRNFFLGFAFFLVIFNVIPLVQKNIAGSFSYDLSDLEEDQNADRLFSRFDHYDPEPSDSDFLNSSAYDFAAGVTSLYAYMEDGEADEIGGHALQFINDDEIKDYLSSTWNIESPEDADTIIDKLLRYGQRAYFKKIVKENKNVLKAVEAIKADYGYHFDIETSKEITPEYFKENGIHVSDFYAVKGAACAYVRFGENGLAAYDYERAIHIIALCYACDYISFDDYINYIANLDTTLQNQYKNFEDIHECYYYGEMFRLKKDSSYTDEDLTKIENAIDSMKDDGYYDTIDSIYSKTIKLK